MKNILTIILLSLLSVNLFATKIYVSKDGDDDSGTGTVDNPFLTIQKGIDMAGTNDTVIVNSGTYFENINYNNKTIVVGSLFVTTNDQSYIGTTIIDGGSNGSVVAIGDKENNSLNQKLIGFTIQNGSAAKGGGINAGSCTISDCKITNCYAESQGGGIYILTSRDSVVIANLEVSKNSADCVSANWSAGGIYIDETNANIDNCVITENITTEGGGGLTAHYARIYGKRLTITNNTHYGFYDRNSYVVYLENSLIANNTVGQILSSTERLQLDYCTVYDNNIAENWDDASIFSESLYCNNSIIYKKYGYNILNTTLQMFYDMYVDEMEWRLQAEFDKAGVDTIIDREDVLNSITMPLDSFLVLIEEDEYGGIDPERWRFELINSFVYGIDNDYMKSLFVDEAGGDFHLNDYSYAIGQGASQDSIPEDLEGNSRISPAGSNSDIGAYENSLGIKKACQLEKYTFFYSDDVEETNKLLWDFPEAVSVDTSNQIQPIVVWDENGVYNCSVQVFEGSTLSDEKTFEVTVDGKVTTDINLSADQICSGSTVTISYVGENSGNANYSWDFDISSDVTGQDEGPYTISWLSSGAKTITFEIIDNYCYADTTFNVIVLDEPEPISICMVGVGETENNMIVWPEELDLKIDSILIYKETSAADVYEKIGSQKPLDSNVFIDEESNIAQKSDRYKIAVLDTCGTETSLSSPHQTIHLQISQALNGGWNLSWNAYNGFNYSTFYIYRGENDGELEKIDEVSSNTFSYTDLTPPEGTVTYQIGVVNPSSCVSTEGLKSSSSIDYTMSKSNKAVVSSTSINNNDIFSLTIWPNPVKNSLNLSVDDSSIGATCNIVNINGQVIKEFEISSVEEVINVENLNSGVYILRLYKGNNVVVSRFLKE